MHRCVSRCLKTAMLVSTAAVLSVLVAGAPTPAKANSALSAGRTSDGLPSRLTIRRVGLPAARIPPRGCRTTNQKWEVEGLGITWAWRSIKVRWCWNRGTVTSVSSPAFDDWTAPQYCWSSTQRGKGWYTKGWSMRVYNWGTLSDFTGWGCGVSHQQIKAEVFLHGDGTVYVS